MEKAECNPDTIEAVVRHAVAALRVTGVCHVFCNFLQFSKILDSATKIGMSTIPTPLIYVADARKTRRLTYSLQPQSISGCAAVFYKPSNRKGEKHYYSAAHDYENSITPAWTNVTTNVLKGRSRLLRSDGKPFSDGERSKELCKHILRQWCRPGGLCYNPMAKSMSVGLAAYELGIKYVALEADEKCFTEAKHRLLKTFSHRIERPLLEDENNCDNEDSSNVQQDKTSQMIISAPISSSNSESADDERIRRRSLALLQKYPDRQRDEFDTDSFSAKSSDGKENNPSGNKSGCAAGPNCVVDGSSPSHRCSTCEAPVHNLCDYGKRVLKDFSREMVYSCSKVCFSKENRK